MRTTITNRISATTSEFWASYLDEDATRRLYADGLQFDSVEVRTDGHHSSEQQTRELHYAPRLHMPAPIKRALGARLRIVERGTFTPSDSAGGGRWTFQVFPSALTEKISISGSVTAEPDNGALRRVTELDIRVPIFGVGGVMEKFIEKTTRENCRKSAEWLNRHFAG